MYNTGSAHITIVVFTQTQTPTGDLLLLPDDVRDLVPRSLLPALVGEDVIIFAALCHSSIPAGASHALRPGRHHVNPA